MKQTVVFDFDGVIHSYKSGWTNAHTVLDEPVEGIKEALKNIKEAGYEVIIVSARCQYQMGADAIHDWLEKYDLRQYIDDIVKEKPPAIVYIDDRAICFDGKPETLLGKIKAFKPWYKKEEK